MGFIIADPIYKSNVFILFKAFLYVMSDAILATMDIRLLAKIDLNLLLALHILLEEQSVSAAARRLSITQPAMSKTLSRLREALDDPLFVRSKRGIQPTPRAEALSTELQRILGAVENLLNGDAFSPDTYRGELVLAISEYVGLSLLPRLTARLQQAAPRLRLKTITRVEGQLDLLASGELDFAIQISRNAYPEGYRHQSLGGSPLAVFVRRGHPLVRQSLTLQALSRFPYINLYVSDREDLDLPVLPGDEKLTDSPGSLETSHLLTAIEILRETDYTLVAPAYLGGNDGITREVVALPLPEDAAQSLDYSLVGHERTMNSPIHLWLWGEITETVRSMRVRTVHRG